MSISDDARRNAHLILGGTLLSIDPASGGTSEPGYAVFHRGVCVESGIVPLLKTGQVQHRLKLLYCALSKHAVDVLIIERIRGAKAHAYLQWSVGVAVAAVCPALLLEMPVPTWKMLAGKLHIKSDETDARAIGQALITLAERGYGRGDEGAA